MCLCDKFASMRPERSLSALALPTASFSPETILVLLSVPVPFSSTALSAVDSDTPEVPLFVLNGLLNNVDLCHQIRNAQVQELDLPPWSKLSWACHLYHRSCVKI